MILRILTFLWFGLNAVIADTTISNNIYTSVLSYSSAITVESGVVMAADNAVGSRLNLFKGLVTNNGKITIGDTNYANGGLSVYFSSGLINKGTIVLNALNETSAPSYYFKGKVFQNDGTVMMIGRGDTGGSTFRVLLDSSAVAVNNGILAYYQTTRNDGNGYNFGTQGQTLQNDGTICLSEVGLYQWSQITGTGCWSVGINSILYLNNPKSYSLSAGQLVYLETSYSSIVFNAYSPPNPITVDGWGNGNMIGFQSLPTYTYVGDTLTVTSGSQSYTLIVGEGYDPKAIVIKKNVNLAAAFNVPYALVNYDTPVVTSRPALCLTCPQLDWMFLN